MTQKLCYQIFVALLFIRSIAKIQCRLPIVLEAQVSLPVPFELLNDVLSLDGWRESILSRRKTLVQDRPKLAN